MRVCFGREFPFEKSSNFAPILWLTVDRETKTQTNQQCVKDSGNRKAGMDCLVLAASMFLCSDAWFRRWPAFLYGYTCEC